MVETKLTKEQNSIISNRMKTLVKLYDRTSTIPTVADKTGLTYNQVQKVLSKNNYYHGIKYEEPTIEHPIFPLVNFNEISFLLDCDNLDTLREE